MPWECSGTVLRAFCLTSPRSDCPFHEVSTLGAGDETVLLSIVSFSSGLDLADLGIDCKLGIVVIDDIVDTYVAGEFGRVKSHG